MKSRDLVGKTIKRVLQTRYTTAMGAHGGPFWTLDAIEFTDGTALRFMAVETEDTPEVAAIYPGRSED